MSLAAQPSLLGLPPELRLEIYSIFFDDLFRGFDHTREVEELEPTSLLQSCNQIRKEATPLWAKWLDANADGLETNTANVAEPWRPHADANSYKRGTAKWIRYKCLHFNLKDRQRAHGLKCASILQMRSMTRSGQGNQARYEKLRTLSNFGSIWGKDVDASITYAEEKLAALEI